MPYALTTTNGTTALHLALAGLGIGPGDEVIVPAGTFGATANAVIHAGGIPVFVDIEEDTWCMDPNLLEQAITPAAKAIIPVHLYGNPANMDAIADIAEKHKLFIREMWKRCGMKQAFFQQFGKIAPPVSRNMKVLRHFHQGRDDGNGCRHHAAKANCKAVFQLLNLLVKLIFYSQKISFGRQPFIYNFSLKLRKPFGLLSGKAQLLQFLCKAQGIKSRGGHAASSRSWIYPGEVYTFCQARTF